MWVVQVLWFIFWAVIQIVLSQLSWETYLGENLNAPLSNPIQQSLSILWGRGWNFDNTMLNTGKKIRQEIYNVLFARYKINHNILSPYLEGLNKTMPHFKQILSSIYLSHTLTHTQKHSCFSVNPLKANVPICYQHLTQ